MTIELTLQQQSAIKMVQNNTISVLTGGPGTGKTTTTKEIINWAKSEKLNIIQAAPTGKAAKRMAEATGYYSSTIHSMLGCLFENNKFVFIYNKDNPIPAGLIILDEISMITVDLMARVLEAIDITKTRLLLVGDADQLPSVGAGAVLRDLLASGVIPHTELDIIHRNAGAIVTACHQIKAGRLYQPYKKLDLTAESPINLTHIECFTPEDTLDKIRQIVVDLVPKKYGFDPVNEIQVISPVNSKGILSCDSINAVLRDALNPVPGNLSGGVTDPGQRKNTLADLVFTDEKTEPKIEPEKEYQFRKYDKVINTKNSKVDKTDGDETAIVNGDIGIVQDVTKKHIVVLFSDPDREVEILKSEQNLLHAYCITCHRFQGSEAPVIIIPVHAQFNYFLSNSWIYTAISRAKTICITVGTFGTIEKAIRNRVPNNRKTKLKERLITANQAMMEVEFADL